VKTRPGFSFVEKDKVFFVRKGQGALVNKRQRRSIEEEAERLLWRRGRVALVNKRQMWSCEEETDVVL
jgi:hypothetical protein